MEYCGGGSIADLMNAIEEPLEEYHIAYICREALKVLLSPFSLEINNTGYISYGCRDSF